MYSQSVTRNHRTAFVLMIDESGSMAEEISFRGIRTSKAKAVAIITNDGPLAHAVLSPRHHAPKVYYFTAAEPMRIGVEEEFRDGVTLADGYECKSAVIELDPDRTGGHITLTEGKYHQIKRMVAAQDNRVTFLERVAFAGIPLDPTLARGEWRLLTASEVELLRESAK